MKGGGAARWGGGGSCRHDWAETGRWLRRRRAFLSSSVLKLCNVVYFIWTPHAVPLGVKRLCPAEFLARCASGADGSPTVARRSSQPCLGPGCSAAPMEPRRPPHRPAPIFGADPGTARDGDLPAVAASKDQPPSSSSIIPGREEATTSAYVNPPGARVGGQPSKWKGVLTKAVALAKLTKQRELASQLPLPVPTGGLTGLGAAAALCEAAASADLERLRTMVLIQGYCVNSGDYDKQQTRS